MFGKHWQNIPANKLALIWLPMLDYRTSAPENRDGNTQPDDYDAVKV